MSLHCCYCNILFTSLQCSRANYGSRNRFGPIVFLQRSRTRPFSFPLFLNWTRGQLRHRCAYKLQQNVFGACCLSRPPGELTFHYRLPAGLRGPTSKGSKESFARSRFRDLPWSVLVTCPNAVCRIPWLNQLWRWKILSMFQKIRPAQVSLPSPRLP